MTRMIRYVDSAGWRWEVCEVQRAASSVPAGAAPGEASTSPGSLYFFSGLGTRRLVDGYPAGWAELPRPALEQLCRSAHRL